MWQLLQHTLKPDLEPLLPPFLFARIQVLPLRSSSDFFFLFNPATVLRNPAAVLRHAGLRFEVRKGNVKTAMSRSPKVTQIEIGVLLEGYNITTFTICQLKSTQRFETDFGTCDPKPIRRS